MQGEKGVEQKGGGFKFITRALGHRNYRLFFSGQSISLVGTWLTRVATSWLVYRLTHSALLLGIVGFAGQAPTLLAPLAGVWMDRWDRHRVLVVTQVLSMVQSFLLAVLALTHAINVWHVLALSLMQGFINAFDTPARQSFVVEMVEDRADLPNAIALNSSMVNAGRVLGPAIAGALIATVGEGWCFLIDGFSYIAVIISLLMMRVVARAPRAGAKNVAAELKEGLRYAFGSPAIGSILLLLSLIAVMGIPYTVLMPVMATKVLHGGPHTLGFLTTASGVGALAGALFLAGRRSVVGLSGIIVRAAAGFGLGLAAFALSHVLWVSLIAMVVIGFSFMTQMAASNTILQTIVEEDKRGRVMGLYTVAFLGTAPFGSLLAGVMASRAGAPNTILFGGVACILGAVWFFRRLPALRSTLRPIYTRMGLLAEAA